jgi:hypothetical protein
MFTYTPPQPALWFAELRGPFPRTRLAHLFSALVLDGRQHSRSNRNASRPVQHIPRKRQRGDYIAWAFLHYEKSIQRLSVFQSQKSTTTVKRRISFVLSGPSAKAKRNRNDLSFLPSLFCILYHGHHYRKILRRPPFLLLARDV